MHLRAREQDDRASAARSSMATAIARLDPYSFYSVPAEPSSGADLVVVGTTGAFLLKACGLPGVADLRGRRPVIGDRAVPGLRALRAGARQLADRLGGSAPAGGVEPIVCLTDALAAAPATAAGVRFVRVEDLAHDLSARPGVQSHTRAQSAVRMLGMQVAGDKKRHFAVRARRD
jgi:hypothetical protein